MPTGFVHVTDTEVKDLTGSTAWIKHIDADCKPHIYINGCLVANPDLCRSKCFQNVCRKL